MVGDKGCEGDQGAVSVMYSTGHLCSDDRQDIPAHTHVYTHTHAHLPTPGNCGAVPVWEPETWY